MDKNLEQNKRKRRVVGMAALRRDPTLLALANRGPADGTFLDRRHPRNQGRPRSDGRPVEEERRQPSPAEIH